MNIAVVGSGYVGLVSGACFAEMGANVWCVDVDVRKIENLRKGILPIYEDGLQDMVDKNSADGRLHFSSSLADCLDSVEIVFVAVGTPPDEDGSADVSHVMEVASEFGRLIRRYTLLLFQGQGSGPGRAAEEGRGHTVRHRLQSRISEGGSSCKRFYDS